MGNGRQRAAFWCEFIRTRCQYPAPKRLEARLFAAEFFDFCSCGCNSFAVRMKDGANPAPLAQPQEKDGNFSIFDSWFPLGQEKHLEVGLFVNKAGNLSYVDVSCCGNSYPVEDDIDLQGPPHEVITSPAILPD